MGTTNYFNMFIEVAEDTGAAAGIIPPLKSDKKSVARYEYEIVSNSPYKYTSDDVIFMVYAERNKIPRSKVKAERERYFSKGRPCFRASPLPKTYGWGVHHNDEGKVAVFAVDSEEYAEFLADKTVEKKKAMRSKRK